jgi:hypothetical protein
VVGERKREGGRRNEPAVLTVEARVGEPLC